MKCEYCENEMKAPDYAYSNAETYKNSVVVNTLCCNKPIMITPTTRYIVEKYEGNRKEDDWGNEINKDSKNEV